ncbi:hypothetical protein JYK02_31980 [Corallococcus macrosporus]|uniref:Annexin n=1 Tax=Corallococcus macrosporus TaxID=35 RepID=A0ABS3DLH6_9BACT|nr:hypothetical protein [Corallococcus macrosporus]MBN8232145.1 hypothetical protein [Corallococcus macrosporus]
MGIRSTTAAVSTYRAPTPLRPEPASARAATPTPAPRASLASANQDRFVSAPVTRGPNLTGLDRDTPLTTSPLTPSTALHAVSGGRVQKTGETEGASIPFRIQLNGLKKESLTSKTLLILFAQQYHKVDAARAKAMVEAQPPEVRWVKEPDLKAVPKGATRIEINVIDTSLKPLDAKDDKSVDGALAKLPPADQKRIKDAARREFKERANGEYDPTKASSQEKAYLKNLEGAELLKDLYDKLPPHVREALFQKGAPPPKDYTAAIRAAESLAKLSPSELEDYLSKTTGTSSDWAVVDASVESYRADRAQRLKGAEALDSASKRIEGTAALYVALKEYKAALFTAASTENSSAQKRRMDDVDVMERNLTQELQRHGIPSIPAFEGMLRDYQTAFEKETVAVANDLMARTDHVLHGLQDKYQDAGVVQDLYQRLSKAREYEARAVALESTASLQGLGADGPATMRLLQQGKPPEKLRAEANSLREAARAEAARLVQDHPILRDDKLQLRDLVQARPEALQSLIQEHLASRRDDVRDTRINLQKDPGLVYGFDALLKASKQVQGIQPGSVQDLVINDADANARFKKLMVDVGLGALGLAAALLPGGAVVTAILTGAVSGVQISRSVEDYQVKDAAFGAGMLKDDPSMADVVLTVAGAGLDAAALSSVLQAVKAFRMAPVKDAGKLAKELGDVTGMSETLIRRVVAAETGALPQVTSKAAKDLDTALFDLYKVTKSPDFAKASAAARRSTYLQAVTDVGADPRVREAMEKLTDPMIRELFMKPEELLRAAGARDPKRIDGLVKFLELHVGKNSSDLSVSNELKKLASITADGATGTGPVTNPKEIQRLFQEKYGAKEAVYYRGIRIPENGKFQGTYTGAGNGQMLSRSADSALTYAKQAPGLDKGNALATKWVIVEVRVRPEDIAEDMYGTMEHIIVKRDVDLTKLPGYRQLSAKELQALDKKAR